MKLRLLAFAVAPAVAASLLLVGGQQTFAFDFGDSKSLGRLGKALEISQQVADSKREISQEEEVAIGNGIAARLLGAMPLVEKPGMQKFVNRVGLWLAQQSERPDLPWRFGVVESDDVNAFSMPGGTVLITRGLYEKFATEADLAGVLAHEIFHVVEKHQLRQIQKQLGDSWKLELASAVAAERNSKHAEHLARAFSAGTEIYTRGLDKQDEFAADRGGVVIAARAGYNPFALYGVLNTIGSISPTDGKVALMFRTHPSPLDRQEALAGAMGSAMDPYAGGAEQTKRFVRHIDP